MPAGRSISIIPRNVSPMAYPLCVRDPASPFGLTGRSMDILSYSSSDAVINAVLFFSLAWRKESFSFQSTFRLRFLIFCSLQIFSLFIWWSLFYLLKVE
jgi:hypothetical protein